MSACHRNGDKICARAVFESVCQSLWTCAVQCKREFNHSYSVHFACLNGQDCVPKTGMSIPARVDLYNGHIKFSKSGYPAIPVFSTSVSPAVLPHARVANGLQNGCLFVFSFRSEKSLVLSTMQRA